MAEPVEERYFNWLCAKVRMNSGSTHFNLFRILHNTEFTWRIALDGNRAEDGIELREVYCNAVNAYPPEAWFHEPCSVLEMLIAFAGRASSQSGPSRKEWFWQFMTNLRLEGYGRVQRSDEPRIDDILIVFMDREYDECGDGGLFPLRKPAKRDQRRVELWYQLFDYLDDQGI